MLLRPSVVLGVFGLLSCFLNLAFAQLSEYEELDTRGLPVGSFSSVEIFGDSRWVGLEGPSETDPATGQVFRGRSRVYRSADGGETWSGYTFTDRGPIGKIIFLNESVGFLLSETQVYRTRDGGGSWIQMGTVWEGTAVDLQVVDELTLYALFERALFVTKDGGEHWERSNMLINSRSIWFTSNLVGYYGGHGYLYRTQDGGLSWGLVETSLGDTEIFSDIAFVNPQLGFVATHYGRVMRTTDGGLSWSVQELVGEFDNVAKLDFSSSTRGVALFGDHVFETTDGGLIWEEQGEFDSDYLLGIAQGSNETIVVGGSGFIISKEFGVDFWRWRTLGLRQGSAMSFLDALTGWVLAAGQLYETVDGGATWERAHFPESAGEAVSYYQVFSDGSGIVVGSLASVWRRSGESGDWSKRQSGLEGRLSSSSFLDTDFGWAMDEDNRLWQTADGGVTWSDLGARESHGKLEFVNESVGLFWQKAFPLQTESDWETRWAELFFSENGGATWENRTPSIAGELSDVRWQGDRSVLVTDTHRVLEGSSVRIERHLWRSEDLGKTWTELISDFDWGDYLVAFNGECVGYAFGEGIYETLDGGMSWNAVSADGFELKGDNDSLDSMGGGEFAHLDEVGLLRRFRVTSSELSLKGLYKSDIDPMDPFSIRFESEEGKGYRVESSSNLRDWWWRCERIVASGSETVWRDEQHRLFGLETSPRFYRLYEVME